MQTRYNNNHDDNIIRITFDRVPQTGTLSKLSAGLDLLDASVNAICDARITEALDTSSIQTLWRIFNEYDFVTGAALTDLDYRLTTLDASFGEINGQNHVKFVALDSSLSGLQNGLDSLRNDLTKHINDTSTISGGGLKPEDIEQYISPIEQNIYNTSVNLNGRINDVVSRVIDCEHDISTLYHTSNITNRGMINDVSNRLFDTNEHFNEYSATVNNHSAQITELYNNSLAVAQVTETIDNINASVGIIKYNDTQRDASISALRDYQRNTVDSLLSSYTQRLNNAESLAVDSNGIANDVSNRLATALSDNIGTINQIANTIDSSVNAAMTNNIATINSALSTQTNFVNQSIDGVNSSINQLIASFNQFDIDVSVRDVVISKAMTTLDSSINYILTVLRNKGLID